MFTERAGELRRALRLLRDVDLTEEQQAAIFTNSLNLEDPQDEVDRKRDEAAAETMFQGLGVPVQRPDRVIRLAGITRLEELFGEETAQELARGGDVRDWRGHPVRIMDPEAWSEEDKVAIRDHFGLENGLPRTEIPVETALAKLRQGRLPQIPSDAYVLTHKGSSFLIVPQRPANNPTPNFTSRA